MAAIVPSSTTNDNLGSLRLVTAVFANTADDGDTWASALVGIAFFHVQDVENPTTQGSVGVAVTESSGTFTFYPAEDNKAFRLFVYLRS